MGSGFTTAPWSPARETLERLRRRALARLRGQIGVDRLIAEGLEVGEGAFIGNHVYIDPGRPWLISIGERAVIAPFVIIMAHDAGMIHHTGYARLARVVVGNRVFVGAGSILLPGVVIGDDSVVGAGSVVREEVPPGSLVLGNPATVVGEVEEIAKRHAQAAAAGPTWPHEGWTLGAGITDERKRIQRETLQPGVVGYLARRVDRAQPAAAGQTRHHG